MKDNETENRFQTSFQQPKTGLPRNPVLTSLLATGIVRVHTVEECLKVLRLAS